MPNADQLYWLLPAGILGLPLLGFAIILFFGKYIDRFCDRIAIISMAGALAFSIALFAMNVKEHGAAAQAHPVIHSISWLHVGSVDLQVGFLVDNLSSFMSIIVTFLGTLVLVYSMFYMEGDSMYRRYFGYMCFFCFAMLGIVFASSLLMSYIFWELVGLGSYFLIGFWFYKPAVAQDHHYQELKAPYATGIDERYLSPAHAQKKAFVMNRIGDFGFAIGIAIFATVMLAAASQPNLQSLNLASGPLNFDKLYAATGQDAFAHVTLLGFSGYQLLTLAGMFTFMGAIGKSAQFPLHTWLPDAMQGPTTGSSIIHAATMVAAGVYLVARIHPLLTDGSLFCVAVIGGITAFLAATMALVQWDLKAVLAYSTISQLGYMMVGLGSGSYTPGVAHLYTHAIFKCMLFLCAGSVIHACHHLQDMNRMGGLRKKMPLTFIAMLTGTLAISGVPLFSGFFSKDAILAASLARAMDPAYGGWHWLPTILAFITAGLTTFYMFRLIFMTFCGEPRDHHVYEHAHESPALATVPLLILATLCLGFFWSGKLIGGDFISVPGLTMHAGEHGVTGWLNALMVSPVPHVPHNPELHEQIHEHAHLIATGVSLLMLAIGLSVAFLMYIRRAVTPERLMQIAPLRLAYGLFAELWFFDRLYQDGIVVAAKKFNAVCRAFDAQILDRWGVDGWAFVVKGFAFVSRMLDDWFVDQVVDLFGHVTRLLGWFARAMQVGKIQFYVCVTFGVAAVVMLGLLLMQ
ncbi:MAG TPA: NADH-quinone oxidoreductase subunit L [Planctomycetota bacterium]|jgi:NADH-quinone oxidoreductase subunit L